MSYKKISNLYSDSRTSEIDFKKSNEVYSNDPSSWGSHTWRMLHTCAVNYPQSPDHDTISTMVSYLRSLFIIIPCKNCSDHYKSYIDANEYRLYSICSSRESLFNFIVDIHNWVNTRLGKSEFSYAQARSLYYK